MSDTIDYPDRYIAIEIGGTKLQLVAGNQIGQIIERRRFRIAPEAGAAGIRERIEAELPDLIRAHNALAVGIGFGGPVDRESGRIACSHQVEGWSDFPLREWAEDLTRLPVAVENDSNAAAYAEALVGAGRHCCPLAYTNMGSGVGGGLVVEGRIYHGHTPGEVEIGHLRLNREGDTVESRCSGWAVDRRIRELCAREPRTLLNQPGAHEGGEARRLPEALAKGDPFARQLLADVAEDFAFGLSHVVQLFHPEVIVVGGGLSNVGEPLRAAIQTALEPFVMEIFRPGPEIRLAALPEDNVPVGALLLAVGALIDATPFEF